MLVSVRSVSLRRVSRHAGMDVSRLLEYVPASKWLLAHSVSIKSHKHSTSICDCDIANRRDHELRLRTSKPIYGLSVTAGAV
jgi:hypothetical protein